MNFSILQKNYGLLILVVILIVVSASILNLILPTSQDGYQKNIDLFKTLLIGTGAAAMVIYIHKQIIPVEDIYTGLPPF